MIDLRQGDCLEVMKDIPDKSINMILDVKEHCNNAKYILEIINKALDDNE